MALWMINAMAIPQWALSVEKNRNFFFEERARFNGVTFF